MTTLYELTGEYFALEDMDLTSEELLERLERLDGDFDEKADNICHVLANLRAQSDMLAKEANRLDKRAGIISDREDKLREYLRDNMERLSKKKIESSKFTINCVVGRDMVHVVHEGSIPMDYFNEVPASWKLDKKDLLDALKKGDVDGAELIKGKSSLRIK